MVAASHSLLSPMGPMGTFNYEAHALCTPHNKHSRTQLLAAVDVCTCVGAQLEQEARAMAHSVASDRCHSLDLTLKVSELISSLEQGMGHTRDTMGMGHTRPSRMAGASLMHSHTAAHYGFGLCACISRPAGPELDAGCLVCRTHW